MTFFPGLFPLPLFSAEIEQIMKSSTVQLQDPLQFLPPEVFPSRFFHLCSQPTKTLQPGGRQSKRLRGESPTQEDDTGTPLWAIQEDDTGSPLCI